MLLEDSAPAIEFIPVPNGTKHDTAVLALCYRSAKSASEIAQGLGMKDSSYFRKTVLNNLVEHGYLIASKTGRATTYRTNREVVREG